MWRTQREKGKEERLGSGGCGEAKRRYAMSVRVKLPR